VGVSNHRCSSGFRANQGSIQSSASSTTGTDTSINRSPNSQRRRCRRPGRHDAATALLEFRVLAAHDFGREVDQLRDVAPTREPDHRRAGRQRAAHDEVAAGIKSSGEHLNRWVICVARLALDQSAEVAVFHEASSKCWTIPMPAKRN